MFWLIRNKQKIKGNSLIESIFWYFYENLVLFRFVSKQFCLFRLFRYIGLKHRNKPKFVCFWFHETNRNTTETDLVSVCFGSNRNIFFLLRGHPTSALQIFQLFSVWSEKASTGYSRIKILVICETKVGSPGWWVRKSLVNFYLPTLHTVKKGQRFSRPQPGCHWPKSHWQGLIK
jgi:hypothetical protein